MSKILKVWPIGLEHSKISGSNPNKGKILGDFFAFILALVERVT